MAETACEAAPYDDICRLDLVKVAAAEGHDQVADQMLADQVFNRTDDYLPPIDLPKRTSDVVAKEGLGDAARRPVLTSASRRTEDLPQPPAGEIRPKRPAFRVSRSSRRRSRESDRLEVSRAATKAASKSCPVSWSEGGAGR